MRLFGLTLLLLSITAYAATPQQMQAAMDTLNQLIPSDSKLGSQTEQIKQAPQAVVFVSFSLPTPLLVQILTQAEKLQIPVVLRGLKGNSFRGTMQTMFALSKKYHVKGLEIDPVWFEQYQIKQVPALVVHGGNAADFDVVYGNLPLKQLLMKVVEQGTQSAVAQQILEGV